MTKTRFIGDIHGKMLPYLRLLEDCDKSIQLGDFGVGFGTRGAPDYIDDQIELMEGNHRFIRGNHDDPFKCTKSRYWIKDGTIEDDIMFLGGAWSIDHQWRTMGVDIQEDEELSVTELDTFIGWYDTVRPRVMVTHTAPINIPAGPMGFRIFNNGSRTEIALQAMLETHRPDLWIFGHWHQNFDRTLDGTRFICLNELEHIDLEI